MKVIKITTIQSENRTIQKDLAIKLGAKVYRDGTNNWYVVHPDFKDFPIDRNALTFDMKKLPEQWQQIT